MKPITWFRAGAVSQVADLLDEKGAESILLVSGKGSYAACGAETVLRSNLHRRRLVHFYDFEANPKLGDVEEGVALCRQLGPDLILAVGGGSVLDMAKLIGSLSCQDRAPGDIVRGAAAIEGPGPPVVAVPTTAGTGSEATHFAAVFVELEKFSVSHELLLPAYAIIDPELTYSLPPKTTAVCGLDALCQAVESMWNVHSTEESRADASRAIRLALDHLPCAVHQPSAGVRSAMSEAAHLSGKAINITKTTAPHAISYTMTSRFNVPHGHAVALTLGAMLVYNSQATETDVRFPGGTAPLRQIIDELNRLFGCPSASASSRRFTRFIESLGLSTRLSEMGIQSPADRRLIVENVNLERLANNPRALNEEALSSLLDEIA